SRRSGGGRARGARGCGCGGGGGAALEGAASGGTGRRQHVGYEGKSCRPGPAHEPKRAGTEHQVRGGDGREPDGPAPSSFQHQAGRK
ncbi:hypothetical protein U0070_027363, partial [Myodes glareolus]